MWFLQQTSLIYVLEMYDCHLFPSTLLFTMKSVDSTPSQLLWKLNCFGIFSVGPVNLWHGSTILSSVCIYITDDFIQSCYPALNMVLKEFGKCWKAQSNMICMQAPNMVPVGCFCSSPSHFHKLFSFCLSFLAQQKMIHSDFSPKTKNQDTLV